MFFSSGGGVFLCPLAYLHRGVTSNSTHKPDSSVFSVGLSFSTLLPSRFFQFPSDLLTGSLSLPPSNCLETPFKWSSSSIPSVYPDPLMSSGAVFRSLHTDKELSRWRGGDIWLKVMERWQAKPGGRWRMMMKAAKLRQEWWFERGADGMSRRQKKEEGEERDGVSGMARCSRSIIDFARECWCSRRYRRRGRDGMKE